MKDFLRGIVLVIVLLLVANYVYSEYNTCSINCSSDGTECKYTINCGVFKEWFDINIEFFGKYL